MSTTGGMGSVWNPGSFHWEEKNYTAWASEQVKAALQAVTATAEDIEFTITSTDDVTVDASVLIRRGKRIPAAEISGACVWQGRSVKSTANACATGELLLTDVFSEEAEEHESDFTLAVATADDLHKRCLSLAQDHLLPAARAALRSLTPALLARDKETQAAAMTKHKAEAAKAATARPAPSPAGGPSSAAGPVAAAPDAAASTGGAGGASACAAPEAAPASAAASGGSAPAPPPAAGAGGSAWNNNSFHWEEKSLTKWARTRLAKLLRNLEFEVPGSSFKIVGLTKLDGDASSSVRKGRKLVFFDFVIEGKWEGEIVDDDGNVVATGDGEFTVPDVDQDTDPASVEVNVTVSEDGDSDDRRLTKYMKKYGVPELRDVFARFLAELKAQA